MIPTTRPFLLIHPPVLVSLMAAAALVLASLQWLYSLMTKPREPAPSIISADFAIRFAVQRPDQATGRAGPQQPSH